MYTTDAIGPDLSTLTQSFLEFKQDRTRAGELDPRTFADYRHACKLLVTVLGADTPVGDIRPLDFDRVRRKLANQFGPRTTGKHIRSCKTMFTWAYNSELLDRPLRYGDMFSPPSRSAVRKASRARRSMFEAHEVRALVAAASPPLRAFTLLGLNAAYGQMDIADVPASVMGEACRTGLLEFDRPKTGIARACVLWPETIDAVQEVRRQGHGRAFLTCFGNHWVRERIHTRTVERPDGRGGVEPFEEIVNVTRSDSVAFEFGKVLKAADVPRRGFYALRRTFRTVADSLPDKNAVLRVMGHEMPGMDPSYVVRVETERLQAVADHVRTWFRKG